MRFERAKYNEDVAPSNIGADDSLRPDLFEGLVDRSKVIETERINVDALPKRTLYRFVKRVFDVCASAGALIVLAIPMSLIALIVKLDSPGPAFYHQERLGQGGKPFVLTKFRSMRVDAEGEGAQWAQDNDPRVTNFGRFLRVTHLDELPQLWGVIRGDLSLVGPRPERKIFYDEFEKYIHGFSQRMIVKPGVSGLAQVMGGYDLLPEEKILYDIEYIKTQNLVLDAKIIAKTIKVMFTHEGTR